MTTTFMFDTNIFDKIINENFILPNNIEDISFCFTHIQEDELKAIPDEEKRKNLLKITYEIAKEPTSCFIFDVSNFDEAKLGDDETHEYYDEIYSKQREKHPEKSEKNIINDSLIGSTCLAENFVLVTQDKLLAKIVKGINPELIVLNFEEFKKELNSVAV